MAARRLAKQLMATAAEAPGGASLLDQNGSLLGIAGPGGMLAFVGYLAPPSSLP